MAPPPHSSSLSSCSSSSNSPRLLPHRFSPFTPPTIDEGNETDEDASVPRRSGSVTTPIYPCHPPTPLHGTLPATTIGAIVGARRAENAAVACNKCRPNIQDKIASFVVPSPNRIFKSVLHGLARRSPKLSSDTSSTSSPAAKETDDRWKLAAAELSRKLTEALRMRDEAILEASELKYSMAELEKKLNKLEIYCHGLKSGFEVCNRHGLSPLNRFQTDGTDRIIDQFLLSVAESRTAVRSLSRALIVQIRQMGVKVFERISSLLQPYGIKISLSRNPKTLIFCLEALLNSSLFQDFESPGFTKITANRILNPLDRCEAQYAAFSDLRDLTWEEVLSKGTKHFSEDFSRFCDRKMGEILGMLGWNQAWPEPLLQAFFGASKSVWLVHLLANSVHPGLPVFRVEGGSRFDPVYMEDMGEVRDASRAVPIVVRIMVAPGFYVYDNVIKCKALCRYYSSGGSS